MLRPRSREGGLEVTDSDLPGLSRRPGGPVVCSRLLRAREDRQARVPVEEGLPCSLDPRMVAAAATAAAAAWGPPFQVAAAWVYRVHPGDLLVLGVRTQGLWVLEGLLAREGQSVQGGSVVPEGQPV